MKDQKKIEAALKRIKNDERLKYPPANVFINAPLALIQVELASAMNALAWVLMDNDLPLHSSAGSQEVDDEGTD